MAARDAATKKFDVMLHKSVYPLVGGGVTEDVELHRSGKKLLGRAFKGVYAADTLPPLTTTGPAYLIVNADSHDQPGSHWMGLAKSGKSLYFYDSFGRTPATILPNLPTYAAANGLRLVAGKSTPEQKREQNDCGARTLAWLELFKKYGSRVAKLVSD
jgi:hypothetical protein